MDDHKTLPDNELLEGEGIYVGINPSKSAPLIAFLRSSGYPTINDLMPVLDEHAPKIEDLLDPTFFKSIDFLRETQPTEQIQTEACTDDHWRVWLDGYLEILSVRMYYYEAAHEAFFKIKRGDSNETSRALSYTEYTERYILKAEFIRDQPTTPNWLKRHLVHIATFQQEEDRFVRFIRFDAPDDNEIIEVKPKTGVISKMTFEVLKQFNSPKVVHRISNSSKIIHDGFFDPKPNRCSETIDRLFSSMNREHRLIMQNALQSKVEPDSADALRRESEAPKCLNHSEKLILHVIKNNPNSSNRDILTKLKSLPKSFRYNEIDPSTVTLYLRNLVNLKLVYTEKPKGRKYLATQEGEDYIDKFPPI